MLSIHYYIALLFGILSLLTGIALLFGAGDLNRLNRHLAVLLLLIGCVSLVETSIYSLYTTKTYHFLRYYLPIDLLIGTLLPPLLYGYIQKLLHYQFSAKGILLIVVQTLPAVALLVWMAVSDNDSRIRLSTWRIRNDQLAFQLFFIYLIAQSLWYCLRCAKKLDKKNTQNDTWLYGNLLLDLRVLRTAFWIILSFFTVGSTIFILSGEVALKLLAGSVFSYAGIFFLAYHSLWKGQLVYGNPIPDKSVPVRNNIPLSNEWGITAEELELAMRNTKIYLDPECSLKSAAEAVGLLPYQLDTFLSNHLNTTFSQYVHRLRIEDARSLICLQPELDMEEVAQRCGFGSKTSFYNAFKRHTGITPLSFQRSTASKNAGSHA